MIDMISEEKVNRILLELFNNLYEGETSTTEIDTAVIIAAELMDEEGNSELKNILIEAVKKNKDIINVSVLDVELKDYYLPKNLERAFSVLEDIKLRNIEPLILIRAINVTLLKRWNNFKQPVIPMWLSDFMVKLGRIKDNSIVLDISTGVGNKITKILINGPEAKCYGLSNDKCSIIWTRLFSYILKENIINLFESDILYNPMDGNVKIECPTHIITAPFFEYTYLPQNQFVQIKSSKSDDLYLQTAMNIVQKSGRIVMLVSDGFLFEKGQRERLRKILLEDYKIVGIIGLNNGLLSMSSDIRANIIVIDKVKHTNNIFMSMIKEQIKEDSFNCEENDEIKKTLSEFIRWDTEHIAYNITNSWIVSYEMIDIGNMSVNRYMPDENGGNMNITPYKTKQLYEIVNDIKNGKTFIQDKNGLVKVLGSPSVRRMKILDSDIYYSDKLPVNTFVTNVGDILMNGIGNQIGESVIVDCRYINMFVGQNAILITPNEEFIVSKYLEIVLNSSYVQKQIRQRAGGTVYTTITANKIKDVNIPLPNLKMQEKIVDRYYELISKRDESKSAYEIAEKSMNDFINKLTIY